MLNFLFPNEEDIEKDNDVSEMEITESCVEGEIRVTTLSGDIAVIAYEQRKKISTVKKDVEEKLKIPPNKQRLLYQDKELKVCVTSFWLSFPPSCLHDLITSEIQVLNTGLTKNNFQKYSKNLFITPQKLFHTDLKIPNSLIFLL